MAEKKDSLRREVRNRGESRFETNDYSDDAYRAKRGRPVNRQEVLISYDDVHDAELRRTNRSLRQIRDIHNEFYAGIDPRRRQEMSDGGMVRENRFAMSNLSPVSIIREYPKSEFYSTPYLDDIFEQD